MLKENNKTTTTNMFQVNYTDSRATSINELKDPLFPPTLLFLTKCSKNISRRTL